MKSDIEKQRHSSCTTIGQTLLGVTIKKVLWGQNKDDKICKRCQLGNNCFLIYFLSFKLCIYQDPRIARAYTAQNTNICALLACLAGPTYPTPARCGTDSAGRGAFEPLLEDVFHSLKPRRRLARQSNAPALQTSKEKQTLESMPRQHSK